MNLKTKLTLMSLLMAFGILQTQIAYAGHEAYWNDDINYIDITSGCGAIGIGVEPWPEPSLDHAIWSSPSALGGPIYQSFEIPQGKTLEISGDVWEFLTQDYNTTITYEAKIYVRKGGCLIIDGATLTRCNTSGFWGGIKVDGDKNLPQTAANQGKVILKSGATVEFAYEALDMGNGGIVEADNSNILNFRRGAAFLENDFPSTSYFKDCLFKVDNDYPERYSVLGPDCTAGDRKLHSVMVSIWSNQFVRFEACKFRNENTILNISKIDYVGGGISVLDANLSILAQDPNMVSPENECLIGSGPGCEFYRLSFGIRSERSPNVTESVKLDVLGKKATAAEQQPFNYYNRFEECVAGIICKNVEQLKISGNVFLTADNHAMAGSNIWCNEYSYEIQGSEETVAMYLEKCPRHIISNNLIWGDMQDPENFIGIICKNSGIIRLASNVTYIGNWSVDWHTAQIRNNSVVYNTVSRPGVCGFWFLGVNCIGDNRNEEILCNEFNFQDQSSINCGGLYDISIDQGALVEPVTFPNSLGSSASSAGNEFTSFTIPAHINLNYDDGMGNVLNYYTESNGYPFEPVHQNFVDAKLGSTVSCVFNDYCLPNSQNSNENYAQKKRDEIEEQYDNIYAIERAIAKFELDSYTYYMAELDTSVATYFKHHWISFNNHRRVMEEGKHNLDLNEVEVAYLYDVVHNQFRINSSWEWCRGVLASYNRYIESTSIEFEGTKNQEIKLYPNPASRILTIQTNESFDGKTARIFNSIGQEVFRTIVMNNAINIESLRNGSYIIRLESIQGIYVQKFMVEK